MIRCVHEFETIAHVKALHLLRLALQAGRNVLRSNKEERTHVNLSSDKDSPGSRKSPRQPWNLRMRPGCRDGVPHLGSRHRASASVLSA